MQTVTYMLEGAFKHADNKGNSGIINPGDIQWMTAGRGIVHSEMPATDGNNIGMQLWVNLAKKSKMTKPQYQGKFFFLSGYQLKVQIIRPASFLNHELHSWR